MHKVTNVSDTSQEFKEILPQGGFGHVRLASGESKNAEIDARQPRFSAEGAPLKAEEIAPPAPEPTKAKTPKADA